MQKIGLLIILFIDLSIFIPEKSKAQWIQTNGPYGGAINALVANGESLFSGTNGAGVFRSIDNGNSWIGLRGGLPSGQFFALAAKDGNVFASTHDGVFMSTDNGISWIHRDEGLPLEWCIRSFAIIGTDLFASTVDSGVYRSTDNGASWKSVNTGLANPPYINFLMASGSKLFAGSGQGLYLYENNGSSWNRLGDLKIINFEALLVNGSTIFAGGIGAFRSTDNGASWTSVGLTDRYVHSFIAIPGVSGETKIFAGTDTGIVLSTDNGSHWAVVNTTPTFNFLSKPSINGVNLFAGTGEGVLLSADRGTLWTPVNDGMTGIRIGTLASFNDGSGGEILYAGSDGGGVKFSTDNGVHWNQSGLRKGYIYHLAYDGINIFAATGSGVAISNNRGESWFSASEGLASGVNAFALLNDKVFAATGYGVYVSTNSGTSWSRSDTGLSLGLFPGVSAITVCDSNIFIARSWLISNYNLSGILYSTDEGISWVAPDSDIAADYITVLLAHENNIFAGTLNYGLYRSANSGRSWLSVNSGLTDKHIISLAASGKNIFAGTFSGIFLSTDGGSNWCKTNSGLLDTIIASLVVSGNNLFAGTHDRGVWRCPLSDLVLSVNDLRLVPPDKFSLYQNYPNPFNPTTIIRYSLPMNAFVTLKVYDILGRDMKTLVDERQDEGAHSVTLDMSYFTSGVYFYRLTAGNFVGTKKLILIK